MAKILSEERVIEYSVAYKVNVVRLTNELNVKTIDIAKALDLHPIMIYRWRQEYREGKFVVPPSRKVSMTKDEKPAKQMLSQDKEIARLKKKLAAAEKENTFLKKWDRYLKYQKRTIPIYSGASF